MSSLGLGNSGSDVSAPEFPENVGLHRFALCTACCTTFLIFVGGLVTSTESGLSVPDWPTTYGWNMFTFPLSKMVGGIFYEHSHRLIASFVGFLTVILAVWTWLKERRSWVRWLALAALGTVILQGILGGITVLFFLPPAVSIAHACLAQTFFCLMVSVALVTSSGWKSISRTDHPGPSGHPSFSRRGISPPETGGVVAEGRRGGQFGETLRWPGSRLPLPTLCTMTTSAVYLQLILGALMRHTKSGLAIPDFPLAFGRIIPPFTSDKIIIHFAHRIGAVIVTAMVVWTCIRIARSYSDYPMLFRPALIMLILLSVQVTLGAITVWTAKAVTPTTAHVAAGALVLGSSLVLTLRTFAMFPRLRQSI